MEGWSCKSSQSNDCRPPICLPKAKSAKRDDTEQLHIEDKVGTMLPMEQNTKFLALHSR